jgi:hypothetical protein
MSRRDDPGASTHVPPAGNRQEALVGRNPWLRIRDLLGQTGTLTKNEMKIQRVLTRSGEVTISGTGHRPDGEVTGDGHP